MSKQSQAAAVDLAREVDRDIRRRSQAAREAGGAIWTPALVEAALEEAGKALLALPATHVFPGEFRTAWPEIVRVIREGDRAVDPVLRAPVPSARAIAQMQARLGWALRYVESAPKRRIVGARMLVHPLSERRLWTWSRLATAFGRHKNTIQDWHGRALAEISQGLERDGVPVRVALDSRT